MIYMYLPAPIPKKSTPGIPWTLKLLNGSMFDDIHHSLFCSPFYHACIVMNAAANEEASLRSPEAGEDQQKW